MSATGFPSLSFEDADAARSLPRETEWITRDGYHRERRGARHLGKPADFHFGELARGARLKQLDADMHSIDARLRQLRPELDAAKEEADALRAWLAKEPTIPSRTDGARLDQEVARRR